MAGPLVNLNSRWYYFKHDANLAEKILLLAVGLCILSVLPATVEKTLIGRKSIEMQRDQNAVGSEHSSVVMRLVNKDGERETRTMETFSSSFELNVRLDNQILGIFKENSDIRRKKNEMAQDMLGAQCRSWAKLHSRSL